MVFSPVIPVESKMIFLAATLPVYGILLGAIIGHIFGKRAEKSG